MRRRPACEKLRVAGGEASANVTFGLAAPSAAMSANAGHRAGASPSILHGFIDQLLHRRLDDLTLRRRLLQQHEEQVLLAVDHHIAAAGAVPFQFAKRTGRRRLGVARVGAHAEAKSEAEAVTWEIEIIALDA